MGEAVKLPRRKFLHLAAGAVALPAISRITTAQTYPSRPLAVTTATRLELLPEIPTVSEFVPGYEANSWLGFGAPKNTPAPIVDRLNKESIRLSLIPPSKHASSISVA
jgi:tripartite-type tricarboxylate transporter receptor subunit TctC